METAELSQQPVIDFLMSPETYGGAPVKRIDTHAAAVFLAGSRAIKIKRVVRFPFLDFSTLEKRRAACEAELAVNRPFAPALYRRVIPITRESNGRLAMGGNGPPVEWAVEMHRFDETQTLDHLAEAQRIDVKLADTLGHAVAKAHALSPVVESFGFVATLENIIAQNDAELAARPDLFSPEAVRALTEKTRNALRRVQKLLMERERQGQVRRCHGDLHLGNIVLIAEQPTLFDAIEFDTRMATMDVLYDLAFLLMDLIARSLQPLANIVLNRYLTERRRDDDLDTLAALPLFMSLRAAIRAKVTAARQVHADAPGEAAQSARDYFALAERLIAPPSPRLIGIGGLSGTGKSLLARALAPEIAPAPGAVLLRSDVERKALFGVAETERLPPEAYSREAGRRVYAVLIAKARRVVSAGHSAIVDAVFADARERAELHQVANGAAFHGLFLTADLATRIARVGERIHDASDADVKVARSQEHYDLGTIDWTIVDASLTPEDTLRNAKSLLGV